MDLLFVLPGNWYRRKYAFRFIPFCGSSCLSESGSGFGSVSTFPRHYRSAGFVFSSCVSPVELADWREGSGNQIIRRRERPGTGIFCSMRIGLWPVTYRDQSMGSTHTQQGGQRRQFFVLFSSSCCVIPYRMVLLCLWFC
jgi:hypothetical protein